MKKLFVAISVSFLMFSCAVEQFQVNTKTESFENGGRVFGESTKGLKKNQDFTRSHTLFVIGINVISDYEVNEMAKKKARKMKNKIYDKIGRKVKDFQWKVANYLTDNFSCILFGNFSTKKTGEIKAGNKMVKEVGKLLGFYKLKEKIKNRCLHKNKKYKEIDESYTSKVCCECGNYNKELGTNKIYDCEKCKIKIMRDVNGAINIMMRGLE
jgi:IS605 OrfB family transposase